jgi:hypothetical protein
MGMVATIVPIGQPKPKAPPSLAELVERVHEMSRDTNNMGVHEHLQKRMDQRGRSMRDIIETVRKGEGVSGPTRDRYGDWRIRLRRFVAGRRVQVVVAVREKDFSVVTVY